MKIDERFSRHSKYINELFHDFQITNSILTLKFDFFELINETDLQKSKIHLDRFMDYEYDCIISMTDKRKLKKNQLKNLFCMEC